MPLQEPQIVSKDAFTVVGCQASFISAMSPDADNLQVLPALWKRLFDRIGDLPPREGDGMIGVLFRRPELERAHPDEMEYVAGVKTASDAAAPPGMVKLPVPAATYAVFTHRGRIETIGETIAAIGREWLPTAPYEPAEMRDVEYYDHRFRMDSDDSEMEYWVAVQPKARRAPPA